MIDRKTRSTIAAAAVRSGIDANALLAVAEVESGGKVFARIGERLEPLIRFEAHYFDRRLANAKKQRARAAGLASPVAGAIANPPTQAARWRMLENAIRIDRLAALESVSWGIGQVMGTHWAWLGYANVEALVAEARSGIAGQTRLMIQYIEKSGLTEALSRRDWTAFARAYNGPGFRRYAYQAKLARAYAKYRRLESRVQLHNTPNTLACGARGKAVEDLQQMLSAIGYPLARDGVYGPRTRLAVRRFQARSGLPIDGVAGPRTLARLHASLTPSFSISGMAIKLAGLVRSLWRAWRCQ